MAAFGSRLVAAIERRGRLCVGIDPHPALLREWGLDDSVAGLETFTLTCVEALAGQVAVLKPQSAFFERHGAAGIAVLERVLRDGRSAGCLMLLDAKRGDIGSTMQGYAEAYLDPGSPLFADAVTLSPFLGFGSLRPALDLAAKAGAGVFVLALTSNPEGSLVQRAARSGGDTVAASILGSIRTENAGCRPLGSVGAVVAANLPDAPGDLDVNGPLLAPGYGAQGGSADDIRRIFGAGSRHVLPSTSRGVLAHGPGVRALQEAARRDNAEATAALS